jgi:RNA-splicing ligase RtcB
MNYVKIEGKYNIIKVYATEIEKGAIKDLSTIANSSSFENSKVRIMPDVHQGVIAPIGFTSTLTDKVVPAIVGVDIGCGVLSLHVDDEVDLQALDDYAREHIPTGHDIHQEPQRAYEELRQNIEKTCKRTGQDPNYVLRSLGTLGGGNHFIECGKSEKSGYWITVHTGSRNFGLRIAKYHQSVAEKEANKVSVESIKQAYMDELGPSGVFDGEELGRRIRNKEKVARGLEYLTGDSLQDYVTDMKVAQAYASLNRRNILMSIIDHFGFTVTNAIESVHNYIDFRYGIIRKGAISAQEGERVVIPLNMRDGLIIGVGKGNEEWNYSAPHGAGRKMSRSSAKMSLSLDDFQEQMKGIVSSSVCASTLDEAPGAYKDADEILGYLKDTVDIVERVMPLWNFKAV